MEQQPSLDEFERTAPIGNAIHALAQAEDAIAAVTPIPPDVAARLDALIERLTQN